MTSASLQRKLHVHGLVRLDTTLFPLVFMDFMPGKVKDEDFSKGLALIEQVLRCGAKSFQITDLTLVTEAPPSQRKIAGDWTARTAELQRQYSLGGAVVAPNAVLRGILTAIHWFKKPPAPTKVAGTRHEAIVHAVEVFRQNAVPVSDEVLALAARSRLAASSF